MQNGLAVSCNGEASISDSGLYAMEITTDGSYKCQICEQSFTSPVQLTIHFFMFHEMLLCVECLKLFESKDLLQSHSASCASTDCKKSPSLVKQENQQSSCDLCEITVTESKHADHAHQFHKIDVMVGENVGAISTFFTEKEFQCSLCGPNKPSIRLGRFFTHLLYFHKCSLQSLFRNLLVKYPSQKQFLRSIQETDTAVHTDKRCSQCDSDYTISTPKIFHRIYCQGDLFCARCGSCFAEGDDHKRRCLPLSRDIEVLDVCRFCDDATIKDGSHLTEKHNFALSRIEVWAEHLMDSKESCCFCLQVLSSIVNDLSMFLRHFQVFHGLSRRFILQYLEKRKTMTDAMIKIPTNVTQKRAAEKFLEIRNPDKSEHIKTLIDFDSKLVNCIYSSASDCDSNDTDDEVSTPIKINQYQCAICDFQSRWKDVHAKHMSERHGLNPKQLYIRCNACEREFTKQRALSKHNKQHHHKPVEEKRFKCSFCSFGTSMKSKIRKHISEHIEASYHPCSDRTVGYGCKYDGCRFIFWTMEKLNEHILNRHPECVEHSYLLCHICGSSFVNLVSLRRHCEIRHCDRYEVGKTGFQCSICFLTYPSIKTIRYHMMQAHPNTSSLFCSKKNCKQIVADDDSFKSHCLKEHSISTFQCQICFKLFAHKEFALLHFEKSHDFNKIQKLHDENSK